MIMQCLGAGKGLILVLSSMKGKGGRDERGANVPLGYMVYGLCRHLPLTQTHHASS